MDSRERTFLSLSHQTGDRVPVDCWMSTGTKRKIKSAWKLSYDDFLDIYDIDIRYIDGPQYIGPNLANNNSRIIKDIWGVPREEIELKLVDGSSEYYREVLKSPLREYNTIEEILDYDHWPSPDWYDYSAIEKQCLNVKEQGRIAAFMGDRLNRIAQLKPAMYLRGADQILIDLLINKDIAKVIFRKIHDFYMEYGARILEAAKGKIDIFVSGDDFGGQDGLFISPELWTEFIEEGFRKFCELAGNFDTYIMHHTCGSVRELIPKMAEQGLSILQSIQPEARGMEPQKLKDDFGDSLCFQGGISVQDVLPFKSPGDVKDHVKKVLKTIGKGGGYIACSSHNIQADTPLENIKTLFKAYKEHGLYTE